MSDKISPVAVVVETLKIFWARKWTFLGLLFGASTGALRLINILMLIGFALSALVSNAVVSALPAVWYEKLRLRQEASSILPDSGQDAVG